MNKQNDAMVNKKYYFYILLALLILLPQVTSVPIHKSSIVFVNQENTIGPWDGSWDYPFATIQDALQHANIGDEIFVMPGIYNEHLLVDFPVSILGVDNPTIQGMYNETIITITADDVLLKNLYCCNSGGNNDDAGLLIKNAHNITVEASTFHHTRSAVRIENSSNITVVNNTFSNNGNGVYIKKSDNQIIHQNRFAHNAIGIVSQDSYVLNISFSSFVGNGLSGLFSSCNTIEISTCNVSDNSVNKGGFFLEDIQNTTIHHCLFNHNGDGISISSSENIIITNCEFLRNTHFALSMRTKSNDITIKNCIIKNNIRSGIYIEKDNTCLITRCNINDNYLYDITGKQFRCFAEQNWWGGIHGPFTGGNEFLSFLFFVDSYPWALTEWKHIGLQDSIIPTGEDVFFEKDWSITFTELDSDGDIIPDSWEQKWGYSPYEWQDHAHLDPDGDALSNIHECYMDKYGSNPFKKDIFLEIDWMVTGNGETNKPSTLLLNRIIDNFSFQNITLHIDIGELGGGSEIPEICTKPSSYLELHNLYWTYFLNNSMKNPRKGIFHYGVLCNYCADLNFPFIGWDVFDSFAISVEWIKDSYQFLQREDIIAGAIIHHLGHTLDLVADAYEGIDNIGTTKILSNEWFNYLSYISCMNYFYKYRVLTFSDGSRGVHDFNDWERMDFSFFQQSHFPSSSGLQ